MLRGKGPGIAMPGPHRLLVGDEGFEPPTSSL